MRVQFDETSCASPVYSAEVGRFRPETGQMHCMAIITPPLAATIVEEFCEPYGHEDINATFARSGAVGGPPEGSRKTKLRVWLETTIHKLDDEAQFAFLGAVLHDFMEGWKFSAEARERMTVMLAKANLRYVNGGQVISVLHDVSTVSLEQLIKKRNFPAVNDEFRRAIERVETEPREAASAAANILEAICKEYIADHSHLAAPRSLDLSSVFAVVE